MMVRQLLTKANKTRVNKQVGSAVTFAPDCLEIGGFSPANIMITKKLLRTYSFMSYDYSSVYYLILPINKVPGSFKYKA